MWRELESISYPVSRKDFAHFLTIAQGSIAEMETQLHLAVRMAMLAEEEVDRLMLLSQEVSKMLMALRSKLSLPSR